MSNFLKNEFPYDYESSNKVSLGQWTGGLLTSDGVRPVKKIFLDTSNSNPAMHKYVWRKAGMPLVWSSTVKRTVGLDEVSFTSEPTITPSSTTSENPISFTVYLVYYVRYHANGIIFDDYGPVYFKQVENIDPDEEVAVGVTVSGVNKLSLWDDIYGPSSDVKLRVYRTIRGGSIPYFLGETPAEYNSSSPLGNIASFTTPAVTDLSLIHI